MTGTKHSSSTGKTIQYGKEVAHITDEQRSMSFWFISVSLTDVIKINQSLYHILHLMTINLSEKQWVGRQLNLIDYD